MDKPHRLAGFFAWWRPRRQPPRLRRAQPIGLERLEERCVATAGAAEAVWALPEQAAPLFGIAIEAPPADPWIGGQEVGYELPPVAEGWTDPGENWALQDEPASPTTTGTPEAFRDQILPQATAAPAQADPTPPAPSAPSLQVAALLGRDASPVVFRIARPQPVDVVVEVRYAVASFTANGTVRREGVAVLPARATHIDVPIVAENATAEVVTFTVLKEDGSSGPSATLFLRGDADRCSETALLEAFREAKSPEAFRALIDRHRPGVLQACRGVLGNWHDAEDISQMVFLALARSQIRLQATLAGWLRAVARNASIVLLRARARRQRHEANAAKPELAAYQDDTADLREEVEAALSRVAEPMRDAVRLRYLEGWSQAEAAALLGCPRGTLSRRASLGLRQLREQLGGMAQPAESE